MFAPLILLAAVVAQPASSPGEEAAAFRPQSGATATATASIRVISGVRFGSATLSGDDGASRRKALLIDASGTLRPAELLEFQ